MKLPASAIGSLDCRGTLTWSYLRYLMWALLSVNFNDSEKKLTTATECEFARIFSSIWRKDQSIEARGYMYIFDYCAHPSFEYFETTVLLVCAFRAAIGSKWFWLCLLLFSYVRLFNGFKFSIAVKWHSNVFLLHRWCSSVVTIHFGNRRCWAFCFLFAMAASFLYIDWTLEALYFLFESKQIRLFVFRIYRLYSPTVFMLPCVLIVF